MAFSTSSPVASVALIEAETVLAASEQTAPRAASGACLNLLAALLRQTGRDLAEVTGFIADVGPGSFTGVKVGVVLAKTLAYAGGQRVAGLSAFELMDPESPVAIPRVRGEWFVRRPGAPATLDRGPFESGVVGYGDGFEPPTFPVAARAAGLVARVAWVVPELLVPAYGAEPSVSTPKTPFPKLAV